MQEVWEMKLSSVQFIDLETLIKIYTDRINQINFYQLEPERKIVLKDDAFSHIKYDSKLDEDNREIIDGENPKKYCDIRLIRSVKHDGTLSFTHNLIIGAFNKIVNKEVNDKRRENEIPSTYIIGKLRLEIYAINHRDEKKGISYGEEDVISIPIKFEYENKQENKNG